MPELPAFLPQQDLFDRLVRTQAEVESLRRELEHTHRLATLGTLSAGIAHEINNILTPVLAYAQLASSNARDRELQEKALEKTVTGVQTATQIAQAMLGFASSPNEVDCANVRSVLQSTIDCLGREPEKDGIKLEIDVHQNLCVRIRPLALQQVLINLIINACTAMHTAARSTSSTHEGGGAASRTVGRKPKLHGKLEHHRQRPVLSISAVSYPNDTTLLRIADSGPGIPSEIADKLFQPFASSRRSNTSQTSKNKVRSTGTGLGLAICKRLIEESGGSISVASKPGEGTTFSISLATALTAHAKAS